MVVEWWLLLVIYSLLKSLDGRDLGRGRLKSCSLSHIFPLLLFLLFLHSSSQEKLSIDFCVNVDQLKRSQDENLSDLWKKQLACLLVFHFELGGAVVEIVCAGQHLHLVACQNNSIILLPTWAAPPFCCPLEPQVVACYSKTSILLPRLTNLTCPGATSCPAWPPVWKYFHEFFELCLVFRFSLVFLVTLNWNVSVTSDPIPAYCLICWHQCPVNTSLPFESDPLSFKVCHLTSKSILNWISVSSQSDFQCHGYDPTHTLHDWLQWFTLNWKVTECVPKLASNCVLMFTLGGFPVAFCTTRNSLVTISITWPVWKTKSPFRFTASEERHPGMFACDLSSRVGEPWKYNNIYDNNIIYSYISSRVGEPWKENNPLNTNLPKLSHSGRQINRMCWHICAGNCEFYQEIQLRSGENAIIETFTPRTWNTAMSSK